MHQKMYLKALVLYLLTWMTTAYQQSQNLSEMKQDSKERSMFFTIDGNVYPLGYFAAKLVIGNPPRAYVLDIDTGSDLTWVACVPGQPHPPPSLYDFRKSGKIVECQDPACAALGDSRKDTHTECKGKSLDKQHPCDYTVDYEDGYSANGFLVRDWVSIKLRNGKVVNPRLTFGCGIDKPQGDKNRQHKKDGLLGLGKGGVGILNQLHQMGMIENIVGHCFSGKGGGYIFFGEIPFVGIIWKQTVSTAQNYNLGRANILFSDQVTDIRELHIIFDSGSTYSYLNSRAYGALLDLITRHLDGQFKQQSDDKTLAVCWKGARPFKTVSEVAGYFKNLALIFTFGGNVKFQMRPQSYLIISKEGNVCLGILDGGAVGLKDKNVIGDISMHDKLVIYDNKNGKVGWADANCNVK